MTNYNYAEPWDREATSIERLIPLANAVERYLKKVQKHLQNWKGPLPSGLSEALINDCLENGNLAPLLDIKGIAPDGEPYQSIAGRLREILVEGGYLGQDEARQYKHLKNHIVPLLRGNAEFNQAWKELLEGNAYKIRSLANDLVDEHRNSINDILKGCLASSPSRGANPDAAFDGLWTQLQCAFGQIGDTFTEGDILKRYSKECLKHSGRAASFEQHKDSLQKQTASHANKKTYDVLKLGALFSGVVALYASSWIPLIPGAIVTAYYIREQRQEPHTYLNGIVNAFGEAEKEFAGHQNQRPRLASILRHQQLKPARFIAENGGSRRGAAPI